MLKSGGLHIIGTERHESRRIDNQLRGRAGRQGDPGSTQFFLSLEDDLLRLFGSERIGAMVSRLGLRDDEALQAGLLTKQIESAQKRIEGRNFEIRKNVLEYDNVMNRQREVIYHQRRRVLMGENVRENIVGMACKLIDAAVAGTAPARMARISTMPSWPAIWRRCAFTRAALSRTSAWWTRRIRRPLWKP